MTDKDNIAPETPQPKMHLGRAIWYARIAEPAFLVASVLLTLVAFFFLKLFIEQMVSNEYDRVTENTVKAMAKEFSGLERSIYTLAALMSASGNIPDESLLQKLAQTDSDVRKFDEIVFMFKNENGGWQYTSLYKNTDAIYSLKMDSNIIQLLSQSNKSPEKAAQLFNDQNMFEVKPAGLESAASTKPFSLFRFVGEDSARQGFVIGVAHAGVVLDSQWQEANQKVLKLAIRDVNADYDFFQFVRPGAHEQDQLLHNAYEFEFAGHRWEIRMEFAHERQTSFLLTVPYFIILFGFILSVAGTLYIHGTQHRFRRDAEVKAVLEQKNKELQKEIEERHHLHDALLRSKRENRSLIDSVSDIIFETDTTGKILFLNATWHKVTGFEPDQSTGLNLFNMMHPQDQDKQRKDFHALVRGQKQPYRSFTRLRISDGSFRAMELSISMTRQDEDKSLRVVGALVDVEERRRAERALGEAEKKYRTIVENAAGGIFQLTPEGVYLSANPALARILGYNDPDDLLRNVKDANESIYFNARERQFFLKELETSARIHNYETQVIRKDGSRIWVNENIHVVRDETGHTLYYEGSLEDITEKKQAEISLREAKVHSDLANRAKSEFLANMSHELRTPLNSIIGFSEIIRTEAFGPVGQNAYKEYALDINESGKRLLRIITEILDIAKIEAGERHLNEQIVEIPHVVDIALKLLEAKARANNLVVSNMLRDVPKVVAEELAVKQILVNLISNAIKFTPSGGRVTITNEMGAEGTLRISITDTGVGLDPGDIEKAMSPFGQLNSALSRANAGTGLGLTVAQALVKLHDGKLEVFSQKGIGTTVTIVFPADRVSKIKLDQPAVPPKNGKMSLIVAL